MARSLRASAAAAAKKILAQAADDGDAADTRTTAKPSAKTRQSAGDKRKREEDSPEYEAEGDGGEVEDEDDESEADVDDESDMSDDDSAKKSRARRPAKAAEKIKTESPLDPEETKRRLELLLSKGSADAKEASKPCPKKRKKTGAAKENALAKRLFASSKETSVPPACCPPERRHTVDYHRPLLLNGAEGQAGRRALLAWYDSVSATRGMPWRREQWLDPRTATPEELGRRAYEVWISEIMAQQTRIAVVIGYWTRWTARWPTVADLAVAEAHEVMHEWSGLGYYSRAARLHEAARVVVSDPIFKGLLPADVATLEDRVPGVGRYTAGAISAIVFGRAAAMVDGNVIRVLSRQLGLFADSKAEKHLVDFLWAAAEALVRAVARDGDDTSSEATQSESEDDREPPISDRPGRWGQALMELGSTICAPKPDCAACPITSTCRTYAEGLRLFDRVKGRSADVVKDESMDDQEDCELCEQFPELDDEEAAALAKADNKSAKDAATVSKTTPRAKAKSSRNTTSPFFDVEDAASGLMLSDEALTTVVNHARTFPLRRPKKPVREVDTLVCAVRTVGSNGKKPVYLLHQRPDKGLLASLWQLPSYDVPPAKAAGLTKASRRKEAEAFVDRWLGSAKTAKSCIKVSKVKELGSIPWLFSHLRQTMHVYLFEVEDGELPTPAACCWSSVEDAEDHYSMGTGMRKCWQLAKDA